MPVQVNEEDPDVKTYVTLIGEVLEFVSTSEKPVPIAIFVPPVFAAPPLILATAARLQL